MAPPTRPQLIEQLAALVIARSGEQALRVAIDGPDAAGKTTLADELATVLSVPVLRASIDGFHLPAHIRHRRIDDEPALGYYEDSFDYTALRRELLEPFESGDPVRTRVFDFRTDQSVDEASTMVAPGTVLLFDGVFLLRPELAEAWDLSVFLRVSPEVILRRALERDVTVFGTPQAVEQRYRRRYLPGQELYRTSADPESRADVVIDNDDPERPRALRMPGR